jgi:hypothetical protein
MSSYTSARRDNADFRREARRLRAVLPPILLHDVWSLPLHATITRQRDRQLLEAELHQIHSRYWQAQITSQARAGETAAEYAPGSMIDNDRDGTFESRFMYAFWRMCEQRIATITTTQARPASRKGTGKPRPPADVRIVTLRRPPRRPGPGSQARSNGITSG